MSIELMTSEVLEAAQRQAQEILNAADLDLKKGLDEATAEAEKKAKEILRRAKAEGQNAERNILSEARRKCKIAEQEAKARIVAEVLEGVRKGLADLVKDENKYRPMLIRLLAEAIRSLSLPDAVAEITKLDFQRFRPQDLEKELRKLLAHDLNITWSERNLEALGGACVTSKDGKIRMSNSLDDRLSALEPRLIVEAGRILFSG